MEQQYNQILQSSDLCGAIRSLKELKDKVIKEIKIKEEIIEKNKKLLDNITKSLDSKQLELLNITKELLSDNKQEILTAKVDKNSYTAAAKTAVSSTAIISKDNKLALIEKKIYLRDSKDNATKWYVLAFEIKNITEIKGQYYPKGKLYYSPIQKVFGFVLNDTLYYGSFAELYGAKDSNKVFLVDCAKNRCRGKDCKFVHSPYERTNGTCEKNLVVSGVIAQSFGNASSPGLLTPNTITNPECLKYMENTDWDMLRCHMVLMVINDLMRCDE